MSERYQMWEREVPSAITGDPLWRLEAYRLAVFVADVAWHDVDALSRDQRTLDNSDQLYRALCSIGANIAEGYSRGSGRDTARFYGYALGSAREARGFYFHGRHVVGEDVALTQIDLLSQIIRLLFVMVRDQRARNVREDEVAYLPEPPAETAPETVLRVADTHAIKRMGSSPM
jgi:four helix bundle protein